MKRTGLGRITVAVAVLIAALAVALPAWADEVVVLAAASLKNALDDAAAAFEQKHGDAVKVSYAASSALAKQIEEGAPADIFISADLDWMNYLDTRKLIKPATRVNLLGNKLVLIAPAGSTAAIDIKPGFALTPYLGADGRLAMADPDAVPAGKYGKAALEKLGAWAGVQNRIAAAADVRAALRFVALGDAPLGIVYATDAAAEPRVRIVAPFPPESYPPIIYPAAIVASSGKEAAVSFLDFLHSPEAAPFFKKQGFTLLGATLTRPLASSLARR